MKIHFLTFSNSEYMIPDRIVDQANQFGEFSSIYSWSESNIPEFIEKHRYHFLLYKDRGFGLWIWKPYVILKRLLEMDKGEILVYSDAGVFLNSNGSTRFQEYMDLLRIEDNQIIAFEVNNLYKSRFYVKADCIKVYYPEFYTLDLNCCYAGVLILKNSQYTRRLIFDWLSLCENTEFLSASKSIVHADPSYFRGQDADNGLLNLVLAKFQNRYADDGKILILSDWVNLYHKNGKQLKHVISSGDYIKADWSSLNNFPFQIRRDVPPSFSDLNFTSSLWARLKQLYFPHFLKLRNIIKIIGLG
jgi:hypothetical protein